MRILINSINYAPELTGIGKYNSEMAEWLVKKGHEVSIVTAPPYYPEWRIGSGYSAWKYRRERISGIDVWRCPVWVPRKPSGLKRLLHLASFAASSLPIMLRQIFWKPDVVLAVEPPLMCAPAALVTARLCGAQAWLHIQDFEVDAAFDLGILRAGWLKRSVLFAERLLLRRFDRVSTISIKMLEKLQNKGMSPNRCFFFPNWADLEAITPHGDAANLRSQHGIAPDQFVALYSGNMGEKQGLEVVLEAAQALQANQTIRFVMCGEGAAKARLQDHRFAGLKNVTWLPLQPIERLNELLNMADVHLLPQRGDVADLVMPSKLLGMLASGRPILSNAHAKTQVGEIVAQCGLLSNADCPISFADALVSLSRSREERDRLGLAGRKIAEERFSKEVVLANFALETERICRG